MVIKDACQDDIKIDILKFKTSSQLLQDQIMILLAIEISDTCQLKIECTVVNSIRDYHSIFFNFLL